MEKKGIILWGLGSMGSGMAQILLEKKGLEIKGAIASRPEKAGQDLGELLGRKPMGVMVTNDPEEALSRGGDLVLQATHSFVEESMPQLEQIISHGFNVISIAEEMAYPKAQNPELAHRIHEMAKEKGVTVLGTGINPGFVLDLLILVVSGACASVESIHASRVNDLSPFGPTVMKTQGVGTTLEEFQKGVEEGKIVGHVGFRESIQMMADRLGWSLDEIQEEREPILTQVLRETPHIRVEPGMVAGCRHIARGFQGEKEVILLEHPQQILPGLEAVETGDYIHIKGVPEINLAIQPEIPGGIGTMAVAINMIPQVLMAQPGLFTMTDLPLPAAILGDVRDLMKVTALAD